MKTHVPIIDGHQDLDEVAQEGDERTDLRLTRVMRSAPNHTAATLDRLIVSSTAGNITAIIRPVFSDVSVRSALAVLKRTASSGSRTNRAHDPHPADLLAEHLVHTVDAILHLGELRVHANATCAHAQEQDRDGDDQDAARAGRPRGHEEHSTMIMIGAVTTSVSDIGDEDLHLRDVVGDAGDERRRPNWPTSRAE